jgi:hypothetical protein
MAEELALADEPVDWLVEGMHVRGTNTMVVAGFKVGKTVLALNLMRSLVDGDDFLGFETALRDDGTRVAWSNYELTTAQARIWVRKLGVENPGLISHLSLRGYPMPLAAKHVMDFMVDWLIEHNVKVWVIDPFAEAYDGDENDNSEVRTWLQCVNEIKRRAGVEDAYLIVHTGHGEQKPGRERARGASRLEGWSDANWYYTRVADSDDLRFLRAFGREVDQKSIVVRFDPTTLRLTRDEAASGRSHDQVVANQMVDRVVEKVVEKPGINKTELRAELDKGNNTSKDKWVAMAESTGRIRIEHGGPGRPQKHYPVEGQTAPIGEVEG